MNIHINGKRESTQAKNLEMLIQQLALPGDSLVVEHNGLIIRQNCWHETILQDDDTIEVLNFVGGG